MKDEEEYCVICEEEITDEDYKNDNVKVPINSPNNPEFSVHVDCEDEELEQNVG